jgi:hypothetical protein
VSEHLGGHAGAGGHGGHQFGGMGVPPQVHHQQPHSTADPAAIAQVPQDGVQPIRVSNAPGGVRATSLKPAYLIAGLALLIIVVIGLLVALT